LKQAPPQRDWNVLFMGSTNRPDVLDPALTRPGRFDRSMEVSFPDRTGRRSIVEYYLSRIKSDDSVDLEAIVADTPGYTPAQIMAAITKDAVRIAIFDNRNTVSQRDIDMAFQEQASGLENPIEELDPQQREQIAYHEAGHALAVYYLFPNRRIVRASIIRRANSLGHVRSVENIEIYAKELQEGVREIMVSLSGDIATRLKYFTAWTGMAGGWSSDYGHVRYWLAWLGEHGFFGPPVDNPTTLYQKEMQHFWKDSEAKTERLLKEHWPEIDAIAQALLIDGDLPGKEIVRIIKEVSGSNGHNPEQAEQVVLDAVAEKTEETPVLEPAVFEPLAMD
jgi:cell division protease FtsH